MIISLLGDAALNGLFTTQAARNKERFAEVACILKDSGLVFANLETPLRGNDGPNLLKREKGVLLESTEETIEQVLPNLNIAAVSLANNHIFDWNESGVVHTLHQLEKLGIKYTGAGFEKKHIEPVILKKNGQSIAFIAYVHPGTNPSLPADPGFFINIFDEAKIIEEVTELKRKCSLLILSLHWGVDYSHYPTPSQVAISHRLIEAGVDVLMGHHTHTIQPFELYRDRLIFYSLGSFCFGDFILNGKLRALPLPTKHGMIANINESGHLLQFIPTRELPGNKIVVTNKNLKKKLSRFFFLMNLKHKFRLVEHLIHMKEAIWNRLVNYFFGYYRNPFLQLVSINNFKKMKFILRDLSR